MADIKLTSSFDPSGIIQGLQQLRTKLRGLTSLANVNPANLAGFNNDLAQAEQKAEAINKMIGKGFSSKQDIQAFNDLNTEFARLTKSATKFMSTMSGEAFSHVSNEIATNFNNAMQSIQQQLDDTQAALKIKMQELGGVFGTKEMQNRVMNQITSGRGLDELYDEIEAGLKGKLTSIPRDTGARTTLVEARGQQAQGEAQVQAYKDLKTELKTLESSIRSQAKTEVAAAKTRYSNDINMSTVRSYDPFSADTIMDNVTRIPGMDAERFGEWVLKALADSIVGSTNPEEVFQKFMGAKLGTYNGRARYGRDIMPVDIDQQNVIRSAMSGAYMATPIGQAYTNAQATMQQRLQTEAVARGATDFETLKSDTNTMIQQWADYVKQMKVAIKNIEKQANIDTANEQKRTAAYIDLTNFQSLRAQQSQPGGLTDLANTYTQTLQQEAQAQQTRTDAMQDASDKSRALKTDTQALNQATETGVQTNINGAKALESQVSAVKKVEGAFEQLMSRLEHFFSIYTIYNKIRQVVRQTFQDVQNLDKAFASIAMVTSKTVEDLWSSYSQYAQIANRLGQSTEDAIKTSALYYQQGLETNEVLQLTESTMKLATLAAQDFETSTQELTAAIRAFHMEMSEGEHVTDVYSELAAHAAADVSNIAAGMSKVASIASSAGSSFESTAAFVTQIIETTQESGVNAGTALKTIVARFTELKENVDDAEESFEDLDYNKIDKALKTVGISLKDEQGQIRDFDDLIIELSGIWDTLSRNQQRYIATVAAGSRQQSRFIALLEDHDRLMELIGTATDSAGRSNQQFAKYADTINYRLKKLKNTWEQFRVNLINERKIKNVLDFVQKGLEKILNFDWLDWARLGAAFLLFGKIAAQSFGEGFKSVSVIIVKTLGKAADLIPNAIQNMVGRTTSTAAEDLNRALQSGGFNTVDFKHIKAINSYAKKGSGNIVDSQGNILDVQAAKEAVTGLEEVENQKMRAAGEGAASALMAGFTSVIVADSPGQVFATTFISGLMGALPGAISAATAAGNGIGAAFEAGLAAFGKAALIIGAIAILFTAIKGAANEINKIKENKSLIHSLSFALEKQKEAIETLKEENEEYLAAQQEVTDKSKEEYETLEQKTNRLKELSSQTLKTAEEQKEYLQISNEIAETHSELILGYDNEGNAIIDLADNYEELIKKKKEAYLQNQKELQHGITKDAIYEANLAQSNYAAEKFISDQVTKENILKNIVNYDPEDDNQYLYYEVASHMADKLGVQGAADFWQKLLGDKAEFSELKSYNIKNYDEAWKLLTTLATQVEEDGSEAQNAFLEYVRTLDSGKNLQQLRQEVTQSNAEIKKSFEQEVALGLEENEKYNSIENKAIQQLMSGYVLKTSGANIDAILAEANTEEHLEDYSEFIQKKLEEAYDKIKIDNLENFNTEEWEKIYSQVDSSTTASQMAKIVMDNSILSNEEQRIWFEQNKGLLEQEAEEYQKIAEAFGANLETITGPDTLKYVVGIKEEEGKEIAAWYSKLGEDAQKSFVEAFNTQEGFGTAAKTNFINNMNELVSSLKEKGLKEDDFAKILNINWQDYSFVNAQTFWNNVAEEIDNPEAFEQVKEVFGKYFTDDGIIPDDFSNQITDKFNSFTDNLSTYSKIMKSVIENGGRFDAQDLEKLKKAKVPLQRIMKDGKINEEAYSNWLKEQSEEITNQIKLYRQKKEIEYENLDALKTELEMEGAISKTVYQRMLAESNISQDEQERLLNLYSEDKDEMVNKVTKDLKTIKDLLDDENYWNYLYGIAEASFDEFATTEEERTKLIEENAKKIEEANKKVADSYQNILDKQKDLADKQKELNDLLYGSDTDKSSLDPMYNYTQKIDYLKEQIDEAKDSLNDSTSTDPQQSLKQWADNLHQLAIITDAASNTRKAAIKNIENSLSNGVSNWLANSEYGFDTNVSDFYRYNPAGFYEYNYDLYARMPKETKKFVDEQVKQMNELLKADKDAQKELKNQSKAFTDYQKKVRDDYISLQDKVVDMLKEKYQEEIDNKKEMYEALEKADNDYLDALQKAIDKERKLRDKQKKWDDLATKEKKLSLMRRDTSGANQKDIQSLEEEIQNDRQQLLDDSVDDVIDSLKEFYETQKESRDAEIEYQQSVLDNANLMKEAIDTILGWKSLEDMQAWMAEHTKNFENLSDETVIKMQEDWAEMYFTVQEYNAATQEDVKEIFDTTAEEIQEEMNNTSEALTKEADRALKEMTQSVEKSITSAEDAVTSAMKALTEAQEAYNDAIKAQNDLIAQTQALLGMQIGNTTGNIDWSGRDRAKELVDSYEMGKGNQNAIDAINAAALNELSSDDYDYFLKHTHKIDEAWDLKQQQEAYNGSGYNTTVGSAWKNYSGQYLTWQDIESRLKEGKIQELHDWMKEYADELKQIGEYGYDYLGIFKYFMDNNINSSNFFKDLPNVTEYASGGLVNYTGPAWVDGTKSKPEAFLSAADTQRIGEAASILHDLPWGSISSLSGWLANPVNSYGDSNIEININVDSIATEDQVDYLINRMKDEITEAANPIGTTVIRR